MCAENLRQRALHHQGPEYRGLIQCAEHMAAALEAAAAAVVDCRLNRSVYELREEWSCAMAAATCTEHLCAVCGQHVVDGKVKMCRCAGCKSVWYCGARCQKVDWKLHRAECMAIKSGKQAAAVLSKRIEPEMQVAYKCANRSD